MRRILLLVMTLALAGPASAADASEQQVLKVLERFFMAMQARDGETIGALLLPDGELLGQRRENGELKTSRLAHADYVKSISAGSGKLLERIWDPVIQVDGDLASAWTPYDFWLNGEFHHCGVNSFSLVRTSSGWRIATVVYSIETENCPPSPLGPLPGD